MKEKVLNFGNRCLEEITIKKILIIMLGAGICSFGIFNIHQRITSSFYISYHKPWSALQGKLFTKFAKLSKTIVQFLTTFGSTSLQIAWRTN